MGRYLFSIFTSIFLFSACGPSTTARQNEKFQEAAILKQKKGEMSTVEGKWIGCLMDIDSKSSNDFEPVVEDTVYMVRGKTTKPTKPAPPTTPTTPTDPTAPAPPTKAKPIPCPNGKGVPIVLQVLMIDMLAMDPTRNEVVEIPTLTGLFKTLSADYTAVVFTSGLYDQTNGYIQLSSTSTMPPSAGLPASPGTSTAPTTMRLKMTGDMLAGTLIAPQKIANVEFHRVQ